MLKLAPFPLLASMALLMAGCGTQPTRNDKPLTAPAAPKEPVPVGTVLPAGSNLNKEPSDLVAEALAASWIRQALDVAEYFERGMRLYPDLREQYQLRVRSGYAADRAWAEMLPRLRERVSAAPSLEGRSYYLPLKAQTGPLGSVFNFYASAREVRLDKGVLVAAWGINMPSRFAATKQKPPGGGGVGVVPLVGGILDLAASSQFNGKSVLDRVVYAAYATSDVSLPLTPEQLLNLRQKSPSGSVFGTWSGGFLSFDAEGVRCDDDLDRDQPRDLRCRFKVTSQSMAPIVLTTTPPTKR